MDDLPMNQCPICGEPCMGETCSVECTMELFRLEEEDNE